MKSPPKRPPAIAWDVMNGGLFWVIKSNQADFYSWQQTDRKVTFGCLWGRIKIRETNRKNCLLRGGML